MKLPRALAVVLLAAACQTNTVSRATARLEASPAALDFGQRDVGSSSSLSLTLSNSGVRTITSLAVSLEAATRPVFSLSAPPATLEAGASVALVLTYLPSDEGADGVTVHLSSDAENSDVRIAVAARAVRPMPTDGGADLDGGPRDAGAPDGGTADGGTADGGTADGGTADGGTADGGTADGGGPDAGFTWDGGTSTCPGASDVRDLSWLPDGGVAGASLALVSTGTGLAAVWSNVANYEVALTFLQPDGTPTGIATLVSPDDHLFSAYGNPAWNGAGFGVAYVDARRGPRSASTAPSRPPSTRTATSPTSPGTRSTGSTGSPGTRPGARRPTTPGTASASPASISRAPPSAPPSGVPVDANVLTLGATPDAYAATIAWTGSAWLAAWVDRAAPGTLRVARVDAAGHLVSVRALTCSTDGVWEPSITAIANLAAVAYLQGHTGGRYDLRIALFSL